MAIKEHFVLRSRKTNSPVGIVYSFNVLINAMHLCSKFPNSHDGPIPQCSMLRSPQ